MTTTSTNAHERVDTLLFRSDTIYDYLDTVVDGEPKYRSLLRIGINAVALALHEGQSYSQAGTHLLNLESVSSLEQGPLDALADQYADVKRATLDRDGAPETDARHVWHLIRLAVPYAEQHYPTLDAGKIAFYGLIHDLVEAEAQDTPSLGITKQQEQQKHENEQRAIAVLGKKYGASWPGLIDAIASYETLSKPEARYIKTFDKLDPGFTHLSNNGAQLIQHYHFTYDEFQRAVAETTVKMQRYSSEFPLLMQDRDELTRRVAKATYCKKVS